MEGFAPVGCATCRAKGDRERMAFHSAQMNNSRLCFCGEFSYIDCVILVVRNWSDAPVRRNSSPLRATRGELFVSGFRVGDARIRLRREIFPDRLIQSNRPGTDFLGANASFGNFGVEFARFDPQQVAGIRYRVRVRSLVHFPPL